MYFLIKTRDQIIHKQREIISGIAKPHLKTKSQIKKNNNQTIISKEAIILVKWLNLMLIFFKWFPKKKRPKGKIENNNIAKIKWIRYFLVKIPRKVRKIEEKIKNKRHIDFFSINVIVKIPKAIPLIIKLKLKK